MLLKNLLRLSRACGDDLEAYGIGSGAVKTQRH